MATTTRLVAFIFCVSPLVAASAESGVELLMPDTTKLLVSLPDPDVARDKFNESQLGKLLNHEKMAKFMDEVEEQYTNRGRLAERLGITMNDLDGVYDGEVALAVIQPGGARNDDEVVAACNEHGMAMIFTGRRHFRH